MTDVAGNNGASGAIGAPGRAAADDAERADFLGAASAGLSLVGFFALLKLADRRDRTPARALGLFFVTTGSSTGALALGAAAVSKSRKSGQAGRGLILGAVGIVLGSLTTVLNLNSMRTRRRI